MNFLYLKRAFDFLSYKLRRPHRKGHGIHSPFLFSFVTEMLYKKFEKIDIINEIENIRKNLFNNIEIIKIDDLGAGSAKLSVVRKVRDIARFSSTLPKYGLLFHKIVNYFKPEVIIELGTCLGMGTMYMATANKLAKIFTIEGSQSLLQIAENNFRQLDINNIFVKHGNFDEVLPFVLNENGKFDLIFIDGNHRKEAVLHYFYSCLPFAHSNSIMIFDDIRWSEEMYEAWCEICSNEDVRLSLDLFKIGMVFFYKKLYKQHFQLYY